VTAENYWVHGLDPIFFHFPDCWPLRGIYWYGVAYILAFVAFALILEVYGRLGRLPFPRRRIGTFLGAVIVGAVAGGRLGYMLLYDCHRLFADPLELLRVWHGGMASHGGFVGVLFALIYFSRKEKVPFLALADVTASAVPLGFFLGRVANFINGEVYGRISFLPWAVIFPRSAPPTMALELIPPRHPSQIYEALLEGVLLFILCQLRLWKKPPLRPGRLCGEFLLAYAVLRIAVECLREPDALPLFGLTRGQFYSLALLPAAAVFFYISRRRKDMS
jgi:phosphatidylglycerol:prolipoprotein diacylglycerol transferase